MPYIIQKTIGGKFKYWMDKNRTWGGLINNLHKFTELDYAERLADMEQQKDKLSTIQVIELKETTT